MFIENKYETESLKKCRGKGNNSVATMGTIFSSPDQKGHVSYCHHLASVFF